MKLEVFKKIVKLLQLNNKKISKLYALGMDITNITDELEQVVSHLIGAIYGKDGLETFEWWCYEKEWGTNKKLEMTSIDSQLLCDTIEDLHKYLEDNIQNDYDIKSPISEKERIKMFHSFFNQ